MTLEELMGMAGGMDPAPSKPAPSAPAASPPAPQPSTVPPAAQAAAAPPPAASPAPPAAGQTVPPAAAPPRTPPATIASSGSVLDSVLARFPSFLTRPLAGFAQEGDPNGRLTALQQLLVHLLTFLNYSSLQVALKYGQKEDRLLQAAANCLQERCRGAQGLKFLNSFAGVLRATKDPAGFFHFPLAVQMADPTGQSPLMVMKDLMTIAGGPDAPEEKIAQAKPRLTQMLAGLKVMTQNRLLCRLPDGSKIPMVDVSGPTVTAPPADLTVSGDLPVGQIVILAKDGTSFVTLYPFFTLAKDHIAAAEPAPEALAPLRAQWGLPG